MNLKYALVALVIFSFLASAWTGPGRKILVKQKLPMISAHRGASHDAPENTLAAFSKAIELGADFLEVDVRTTSDGAQVCLHDQSLKRTTGAEGEVKNRTLEELKKLTAAQGFESSPYAGEKIPTLDELCAMVNETNKRFSAHAKLYVDCKDIDTGEVIRILSKYQLLDSAVFYGDITVLKEIRKFHENARLLPAYPGTAHRPPPTDK